MQTEAAAGGGQTDRVHNGQEPADQYRDRYPGSLAAADVWGAHRPGSPRKAANRGRGIPTQRQKQGHRRL